MSKRSRPQVHPLGGPVTSSWLAHIGITTIDEVRRIGSVEIYRLLKQQGYPVSLNLVYGLEGAILGVPWNRLPDDVKAELRAAIQEIRM